MPVRTFSLSLSPPAVPPSNPVHNSPSPRPACTVPGPSRSTSPRRGPSRLSASLARARHSPPSPRLLQQNPQTQQQLHLPSLFVRVCVLANQPRVRGCRKRRLCCAPPRTAVLPAAARGKKTCDFLTATTRLPQLSARSHVPGIQLTLCFPRLPSHPFADPLLLDRAPPALVPHSTPKKSSSYVRSSLTGRPCQPAAKSHIPRVNSPAPV